MLNYMRVSPSLYVLMLYFSVVLILLFRYWSNRLMFFASLATMHFQFVLNRTLLLHVGPNYLTILSSYRHFRSLDNSTGPPVVCKPCNLFDPLELLFSVLLNHALHSVPLLNYLASVVPSERYSRHGFGYDIEGYRMIDIGLF